MNEFLWNEAFTVSLNKCTQYKNVLILLAFKVGAKHDG